MAPPNGYHLVPKAVRAMKYAISRSSDFVLARLLPGSKAPVEAVPVRAAAIPLRSGVQALHPFALLRQSRMRLGARQARLFTTAVARLGQLGSFGAHTIQPISARLPVSATRSALRTSTFAPFASPLRPNLTGGALPRGAGGYGLGGGGINSARHFSHTSSAQAQVVQNVHAAVRAFILNGQKPLYNGVDPRTGAARFRAVGPNEATAYKRIQQTPRGLSTWEARGTSLDFNISPTITAISSIPRTEFQDSSVLSENTVSDLATDFAHQLRDVAAVHADLKRLSQLGTLPVARLDAATLRVRFPGCDAQAVYALCDEVGVTRGVVREDPGWNEHTDDEQSNTLSARVAPLCSDRDVDMALLFPWAPTEVTQGSPYRGSDYDGDYMGGVVYFEHEHQHPQNAMHQTGKPGATRRNQVDLEWRSMLSSPSPHGLPSADLPSSPLSHELISLREASDLHTSPIGDFESLATSEAASLDGQPINQQATITQTGYEGVEGIYRFLREIEGAETRAGYR